MSHESVEPGRAVVYKVPMRPSDTLRTMQFSHFFRHYHGKSFCVRTADGWSWSSAPLHRPSFIATFRTRERLDAVVDDATEATLGSIFLDGDLEIQGDISALLPVAEYTLRRSEGLSGNLIQSLGRLRMEVSRRLKPGRRTAAIQNWHRAPCPLDLPVEFFEPWLGGRLLHSCAVFRHAEESFSTAQQRALESVCEALNLDRGDRLLDVGCGWGSLLLYAAEHARADVQGIASTEIQAEAAAERICRAGFGRRSSVECRDLRSAPYRGDSWDKIADIGIFEQVVFADLPDYLTNMHRMLCPGGLLLLHRMTRARTTRGPSIRSLHPELFAEPLSRELETAEAAGFEVIQVSGLEREYERTLRMWIEGLRQSWFRETARPTHREYRAWLLYLVEAAANLQTGDLQVHRVVLRRPARRQGPGSYACSAN